MARMKNIMPSIYRQRMIIEAIYQAEIDEKMIKNFIKDLSDFMGMTILFKTVQRLAEQRKIIYKGFEAIAVWSESGIQFYSWEDHSFLSLEIYSCKKFNSRKTADFVKRYFDCKKIVYTSI